MAAVPFSESSVWTAAGGGPARTGLFPGPVAPKPKPARQLATRGAVQAAVVFDEAGHAYAADMAGWIHSWDAGGRPCWRCPLEGAVSATPTLDQAGGRLFVGTHAGWVYALATADGRVLWRQQIPTASDPRILSDLLFQSGSRRVVMSSWGGRFHALDADSGRPVRDWDAGLTPAAGAAADSRGLLYCLRVARGAGVTLVRRSADGEEVELHRENEGPRGSGRIAVTAAPVLDEARGRVWFVANDGRDAALLAWSLPDARVAGRWTFARSITATPALAPDGSVRVADMAGVLHAVAVEAPGTAVFRYETGAEYLLAAPVCDAAGRCYLGDPLGRLHAVDASGKGQVLFEALRSVQARAAFDEEGNLYLPGTDRRVYVFKNTASV
jgi:outer membrane protein assembly factor BamB